MGWLKRASNLMNFGLLAASRYEESRFGRMNGSGTSAYVEMNYHYRSGGSNVAGLRVSGGQSWY